MPGMTDPRDALVSFQQALLDGEIRLRRGELDSDIFMHADSPALDVMRLTYVRLDGRTVKAFVNVVSTGFNEGIPVFQLGVAVPEQYRKMLRIAPTEQEDYPKWTGIRLRLER